MKFDGNILKQMRLLKGYKQIDIAELTKQHGLFVDSRTLSHWENSGKANPRPRNVAVVAKVLGVEPEVFYSSEENVFPNESQKANLSSKILPPYIKFWETVGYACSFDEDYRIILRTSGRKKDLRLSPNDMQKLYNNAKDYCDFLLYQHFKKEK